MTPPEVLALAVVVFGVALEIGYQLGRRAALDDVLSAFNKLPLRDDVRDAIHDGLESL